MKNVQHEWSKNDLTIAYYLTRWDYSGLGINDEDIVDSVIPNTTVHSLNMQMANFRFLLNLDGYVLSDASTLMKEIVDTFENSTTEFVKNIVINFIQKCDVTLGRNLRTNRKVNEKKDELNRLAQEMFDKKLKSFSNSGRRLVRMAA